MDDLVKLNLRNFIFNNKELILNYISSDELINLIIERDHEFKFIKSIDTYTLENELDARGALNQSINLNDFDIRDIVLYIEKRNMRVISNEIEELIHEIVNKKSLNKNTDSDVNLLCDLLIGRSVI